MTRFEIEQELSTNSSTMGVSRQCHGTAIGQLQGLFVCYIPFVIFVSTPHLVVWQFLVKVVPIKQVSYKTTSIYPLNVACSSCRDLSNNFQISNSWQKDVFYFWTYKDIFTGYFWKALLNLKSFSQVMVRFPTLDHLVSRYLNN